MSTLKNSKRIYKVYAWFCLILWCVKYFMLFTNPQIPWVFVVPFVFKAMVFEIVCTGVLILGLFFYAYDKYCFIKSFWQVFYYITYIYLIMEILTSVWPFIRNVISFINRPIYGYHIAAATYVLIGWTIYITSIFVLRKYIIDFPLENNRG